MFDDSIHKFLEEGDLVSLVGLSPLVPFDLYWVKKNGKKVLIKNSGDLCSRKDLEKWTTKGLNLEHSSSLNIGWIEKGIESLNNFFELQKVDFKQQKDIQSWRKDFINWLNPSLWDEQESVSRLDICFLMGTGFYTLTSEEESLFLSFPLEIQTKNFLSASFGTLLALVLGYTDKAFLEDFFKVMLFMDVPFCKTMWSESEKNFVKQEWNVPGLGDTLSADVKNRVLGLYKFEATKERNKFFENIRFKGILKYLTWSLERTNGEGPLYKVTKENLNDLDVLTIFINHSFSYEEDLKLAPQKSILKELFNKSNEFKDRNMKNRFEVMVQTSFTKAQELKDGYLQIVGL